MMKRLLPIFIFLVLLFYFTFIGQAAYCVNNQISQPIKLPLEVMGSDGTVVAVQIAVPSTPVVIRMTINNLSYPDKASIQIGHSPWIALNKTTCKMTGIDKKYGGIGSALGTLTMTVDIPVGSVQSGVNIISFRFNKTDGVSSGYRVLSFNLLDSNGKNLLPQSDFLQDDPNKWTPPLDNPTDIAKGNKLWHTAVLNDSPIDKSPIKATCSDCHTDNGRDLKYFNFSNHSIIVRSEFHGLTQLQGKQIASFIRSLNVPNPGRPWNPPYQPGLGLDKKPVTDWAAGAGLDSVLSKSTEMLPYIFPTTKGVPIAKDIAATQNSADIAATQNSADIAATQNSADIAATQNLDARQLPIANQLPDWNQWLPQVWPGDTFSAFHTSLAASRYLDSIAAAQTASATSTASNLNHFSQVLGAWLEGIKALENDPTINPSQNNMGIGGGIGKNGQPLTSSQAMGIYSIGLWSMVKQWSIMQKYGLENKGIDTYGAETANGLPIENRTWLSGMAFSTSPAFDAIYGNSNGHGGIAAKAYELAHPGTVVDPNPLRLSPFVAGSDTEFEMLNSDWYYLQMILNAGDRHRWGNDPIDWGYFPGRVMDLSRVSGVGDIGRLYAIKVKELQQFDNGIPPDASNANATGWTLAGTTPGILLDFSEPVWNGVDAKTEEQLNQAYLQAFLSVAKDYTPQQYWTQAASTGYPNLAQKTSNLTKGYIDAADTATNLYASLPLEGKIGVNTSTIAEYERWLETLLPNVDWNEDK